MIRSRRHQEKEPKKDVVEPRKDVESTSSSLFRYVSYAFVIVLILTLVLLAFFGDDESLPNASADEKSAYPAYELEAVASDAADAVFEADLVPVIDDEKESSSQSTENDDETAAEDDDRRSENDEPSSSPKSIFVDGDAEKLEAAPSIQVLAENHKLKYRLVVLEHERYYRKHLSKLFVPRLRPDVQLTRKTFSELFVKTSQPVIVPFSAMRDLGFSTTGKSLDDLLEIYPNHRIGKVYAYGGQGKGPVDLGPALATLKANVGLRKTSKGRNFPRNMKTTVEKIAGLGVDPPPVLLDDTTLMSPSLWFGTTVDSTKLHSDCCDNFAMMISGTKRWTISPPSEARILKPKCTGGLCWVKSLEHSDEHASTPAEIALRNKLQRTTFDVSAGEMLYLPCGWFHHVENVGPTIMVNWWAKGLPGFVRMNRDGERIKDLTEHGKSAEA